MSDAGKPPEQPDPQQAQRARDAMVRQAFVMLAEKLITEVNAMALLAGVQPAKIMLGVFRDSFFGIAQNLGKVKLPPDVENDLRAAQRVVELIDQHFARANSNVILAPANTKVNGKKIQ